MNQILSLLFILTLVGCSHKKPTNKISDCHQLLGKIILLQSERSEAGKRMVMVAEAFKTKHIQRQDYMEARDQWLSFENAMITRLGRLYFKAQEKKCFDNIKTLK